jgi:hypothetical protein
VQRLYSAANLPEAYLVRGLLAAAGIDAQVMNEFSPGALGELPPGAVVPEIWIEDERDLDLAHRLVRAYEAQDLSSPDRSCTACGESSPASFLFCWHCQQPLST